jgi:hypothetical protein
LQDSVNIAQKEQQDFQQKLKDVVSSLKITLFRHFRNYLLIFNLNCLLFQEAEKEKLLNALHEEEKKVICAVIFIYLTKLHCPVDG